MNEKDSEGNTPEPIVRALGEQRELFGDVGVAVTMPLAKR